uniref:Metallo-beta-lactamase domain-containing protein 1 n=1 Tax=Cyanoderma ruficeps TaxID=181631 RepID=A0A8C3QV66_9PASS
MPRGFRTAPLGSLCVPGPLYSVRVLRAGFAERVPAGSERVPAGSVRADGSVTLVSGGALTVLVDTGGPWLRDSLPGMLQEHGVTPDDVTHVIVTHGHSDHAGNVNLFPSATLLMGFDLSRGEGLYLPHGLAQGVPLVLHPGHLEVIPTPGHTRAHVSLVASGTSLGTVAVAGDAFERREDEEGDEEGREGWEALSEDPPEQRRSRRRLLRLADVIVPGHGRPFGVTKEWGHGGHHQEEEEEKEEEEDEDGASGRGDGDGGGDESPAERT